MNSEQSFVEGQQGRLWVSASENVASHGRLPVVLVHADLGTLHQWDEFRAGLEGQYATLAFDRRGHGRSDLPRDDDFSVMSSSSDIGTVADRFRLARFALVGHSGGALMAWSYAASQPEKVAGVLLVDPPLDASTLPPGVIEQTLMAVRGPDVMEVTENYYRSLAGTNPSVAERIVAEARATPQATIVGCLEALRDFKPHLLAGRYPGPMLSIMQPQFDREGAWHRYPPGWPHRAIPGTAHWIHLDAARIFLAYARAFLDGLTADASTLR